MTTGQHPEGTLALLKYSAIADRARLAVAHFLDPEREMDDSDRGAIEDGIGFLAVAREAQEIATQRRMQGFTSEGAQVRRAAYDVGRRLSQSQEFQLIGYLNEVEAVLRDLQQNADREGRAGEVQAFLEKVGDLLLARASQPIEVVREQGLIV